MAGVDSNWQGTVRRRLHRSRGACWKSCAARDANDAGVRAAQSGRALKGGTVNAEISDDDGARGGRAACAGRAARPAAADKKYMFALVPKNTNNPFFDQARGRLQEGREGTERRRSSASTSAPASTAAATRRRRWSATSSPRRSTGSRVAGERRGDGRALQGAKAANIPILTWDSDLLDQGQGPAHRLYRHA